MTDERREERPDYVPAHKLPAWLSSADVHASIRQLADEGVDKAACWDFTQAVYKLVEQAQGRFATTPEPPVEA